MFNLIYNKINSIKEMRNKIPMIKRLSRSQSENLLENKTLEEKNIMPFVEKKMEDFVNIKKSLITSITSRKKILLPKINIFNRPKFNSGKKETFDDILNKFNKVGPFPEESKNISKLKEYNFLFGKNIKLMNSRNKLKKITIKKNLSTIEEIKRRNREIRRKKEKLENELFEMRQREAKKLMEKADNNYIIYSSINIDKNGTLYFKYIHKSGKGEKFYFEYSPLLKCFIYFINKNNDKYFKTIQGNFYNSKSEKLIDKQYEINNKGENVINLSKIFKKAETINERHDRIINRYIKLHRPVKRITVDEFEENKKKSKDDSLLKNNNSKSQKLKILRNTSRSKSFLRIKGEPKRKSILKPSRSYINLKTDEKKIQFGKAKIKKYKNKKD